ncbi:tRNA pseudouridine(13) synthase TruD [Microbulbifer spongiae]|uniref:tRNA pseudouridine synthase D n=1 Tax=Microbulbifer spongiae TaxID=2944933 RepID=A0ABY9ECA9_9GAMM|nr:tRNA pseudouridine(13) synthase TruD [Microbulbifer sp. MI-G]WKD50664.1 tRNA pseudouridine(13) synthase TruD [Microbulbifer sp. MI-G]
MTEGWKLDWPRALGAVYVSADFRTEPEDFVVEELAFPPPSENGEHVYLQIRKRGANTAWVAKQLATLAGVNTSDVGYFGLKDRHGLTTQWFSVWLGKKLQPDWSRLNGPEISVLHTFRGSRKLRRGEHSGNRFKIRLRSIRGKRAAAEQRLDKISAGVPNYFGEQRFGIHGNNLDLVRHLAEGGGGCGKSKKAFAMSAARSWLFNQVLAERVDAGNWREVLDGEPEANPSGPLWGRGRNPASRVQEELEQRALLPWQPWCNWLEHCGLRQERRALVLRPEAFHYQWEEDSLVLGFSLSHGEFATALLREVAQLVNVKSST